MFEDPNIQLSILKLLCKDKALWRIYLSELHKDFFDAPPLKIIFEILKLYYTKYHALPNKQILKLLITQTLKKSNSKYTEIVLSILDSLLTPTESQSEEEFIKDEFIIILKTLKMQKALEDCKTHLHNHDFKAIEKAVTKAQIAPVDIGTIHFNESPQQRISNYLITDCSTERIPTFVEQFNGITGGGFKRKHVFLLEADPNIGKTAFCANAGIKALRTGHTVVHYTFDLNAQETQELYDACLAGRNRLEIKIGNPMFINALIQEQEILNTQLQKKLIIKEVKDQAPTPQLITQHLYLLHDMYEITPDFLIVDFFQMLKPSIPGGKRYEQLVEISSDISRIANIFNVAILLISAVSKQQYESDMEYAGGKQIQGAYGTAFIIDEGASLNQTKEQATKHPQELSWHIFKSRIGGKFKTYDLQFDPGSGRMSHAVSISTLLTEISTLSPLYASSTDTVQTNP